MAPKSPKSKAATAGINVPNRRESIVQAWDLLTQKNISALLGWSLETYTEGKGAATQLRCGSYFDAETGQSQPAYMFPMKCPTSKDLPLTIGFGKGPSANKSGSKRLTEEEVDFFGTFMRRELWVTQFEDHDLVAPTNTKRVATWKTFLVQVWALAVPNEPLDHFKQSRANKKQKVSSADGDTGSSARARLQQGADQAEVVAINGTKQHLETTAKKAPGGGGGGTQLALRTPKLPLPGKVSGSKATSSASKRKHVQTMSDDDDDDSEIEVIVPATKPEPRENINNHAMTDQFAEEYDMEDSVQVWHSFNERKVIFDLSQPYAVRIIGRGWRIAKNAKEHAPPTASVLAAAYVEADLESENCDKTLPWKAWLKKQRGSRGDSHVHA